MSLDTFRTQIPEPLRGFPRIQLKKACRPHLPSPKTLLELCGDVLNAIPLPHCWNWALIDVSCWLCTIGLRQYQEAFMRNYVNGRKLLLVDASGLVKMNIHDFDHIKKITAGIRALGGMKMERPLKRLSEPCLDPETFYIMYRVNHQCSRMDFFYKANIIQRPEVPLNHWDRIEPCPPKYPPDQYRVETWPRRHYKCDWEKRADTCLEVKSYLRKT